MNSQNNRQYQALVDVRAVCAKRADVFRGNPVAEKMLAQLDAAVKDAAARFAEHQSSVSAHRDATKSRRTDRAALRDSLNGIAKTAPVVAIETGTPLDFDVPKGCSDLQLTVIAKDFAERAMPLAERFAGHRLPPQVVADLPERIAALERAVAVQREARRGHKVARQSIVAAPVGRRGGGCAGTHLHECVPGRPGRGTRLDRGAADWSGARDRGSRRSGQCAGDDGQGGIG
jgi:hypothetical protein